MRAPSIAGHDRVVGVLEPREGVSYVPLRSAYVTCQLWSCPSFSAVLGTLWRLAWMPCCLPMCSKPSHCPNLLVPVDREGPMGSSPTQGSCLSPGGIALRLTPSFHHGKLHLCALRPPVRHLLGQQIIQNWQNI